MPAATGGTVDPIGPWRPLDSKVQAARNAAYQTPSMDYSLTVTGRGGQRAVHRSGTIWLRCCSGRGYRAVHPCIPAEEYALGLQNSLSMPIPCCRPRL